MPTVHVTRTYLQMTDPAQLRTSAHQPAGVRLEGVTDCPPEFYRFLYDTVGREYHWRDRSGWDDAAIRAWFGRPGVLLRVLYREGAPAGYYELARHRDGSVEIVYFGLMPGQLGQGFGRFLLEEAVREAWGLGAARVWLHTCTLDGPAALPNYLKRGFVAFRTEEFDADISAGSTDALDH
ncbi:MAG TPA: GNAT family N-acetyltransferase [Gemmatimonadales bacterium]|nr:GNAT family N-acetyltransferase [Gemmatimonadales bacterium]